VFTVKITVLERWTRRVAAVARRTRPGDTLTFGAGSYIRAFSTEEFRQFTDRPDGIIYGRGWHTTTQPDPPAGLLEERPRRRGVNRLLPTGWRRRR
jgi:hypothetical protein